MSRIGKKPVPVPKGVTVRVAGGRIEIKGPKGEISGDLNPLTECNVDEGSQQIVVERKDDTRPARMAHGLQRSLVANMVQGVSEGYTRAMEVHGTGYTAEVRGKELALQVGFATPATIEIPDGIAVEVQQRAAQPNNPAKFSIAGVDKHLVGQFAANVRRLRPPEPYNGKGVRYADETVRRKEGKAAIGTGH
jgi:large subunit ribosomal protein L6